MTCRVGNVIFIKTRHFLIAKRLLDRIIRVIFLLSLQNNKIRDSYFMEGSKGILNSRWIKILLFFVQFLSLFCSHIGFKKNFVCYSFAALSKEFILGDEKWNAGE